MRIVSVTSEANPLAKTGGLADVVYSLSKVLAKNHDVSIIMPFYRSIEGKVSELEKVYEGVIYLAWRKCHTTVFLTNIDGINYFLIKNNQYFNRDRLYGYDDDIERFAFLTVASKELMNALNIVPDIIHIHDWQPGMLPLIVKNEPSNPLNKSKFVLTIHNPAFKGYFDPYNLGDLYGLSDEKYKDGSMRFNGAVSTLKTAIVFADKITTVSPTHRLELLNQDISDGLEHVLEYRRDDFVGILNGIDIKEFSPSFDNKIYKKYNLKNYKVNKLINKHQLEKELNLEVDDAPLFGMVSRLTWQKGLDILLVNLKEMLAKGHKVVILGSGEHEYEQALEDLRRLYPRNLAIYIGYNDDLAHKIYAACDFFLMPSLFEPCGLSQMISLKYATLPIVRKIGGLKDSVMTYDGDNLMTSDGFGFDTYSIEALRGTIAWCEQNYNSKEVFNTLRENAMKRKLDWGKSAREYLKLYKSIK